jgi:hypothetical protein
MINQIRSTSSDADAKILENIEFGLNLPLTLSLNIFCTSSLDYSCIAYFAISSLIAVKS